MSTTIKDVLNALEDWAPRAAALSYDNVGLQTGRPSNTIRSVLVALDLVPQVVNEARDLGADLIVTHHPPIFKSLKSVSPATFVGGMILDLAESGIACISAHTNLDVARGGVSFALAEFLGLENITFLDSLDSNLLLAVCVCPANLETKARKIALEISCNIESVHQIQTAAADHVITEFEISLWTQNAVALRLQTELGAKASIRFSELSNQNRGFGLGAVGTLPKTEKLSQFLAGTCGILDIPALRFSGDPDADVSRVAVCGGSGSSLLGKARAVKADVLLTADVSYHSYFDVLDANGHPDMALVDVGHYESEVVTENILVDFIVSTFPELSCRRTSTKTSPMQHFVL